MLKNAPILVIVAVHTAENEPLKVLGVLQIHLFTRPSEVLMMNLLVGVLSKSYDHYFGRAQELFVRERALVISSLRTRPWVRNLPKESAID